MMHQMNGPPKQVLKWSSPVPYAQPDFGAGNLAGVAGNEVVDRLIGAELRDGRHHARGIAGQEDNVLGMSGALLRLVIRNVRKRISRARVFRHAVVVQIQTTRDRIEGDIFQHGAEAPGTGVNLRLGLFGQTDDFGVAAIFKVEDAVVAPAMFVVANQMREGSAESVVLPVPDSPKKIATSPSAPTLAEQCIDSTPCSGNRKFNTVKTVFLISPA